MRGRAWWEALHWAEEFLNKSKQDQGFGTPGLGFRV